MNKLILIACLMMLQVSLFSQTSDDYYNQAKQIDLKSNTEKKQAITLLNKALIVDAKNKNALILRAKLFNDINNYKGEIVDLTSLIQIDSSDVSYYETRAKAYLMNNDPEKAISDYTFAFKKDTSKYECIYERGKIYLELFLEKKSEQAMNDFNYCIYHASITIKSLAYVGRGRVYEGLGKTKKAMDDYNTAMKINPLNKEVFLYRGLLKLSLNQDGCYDLQKYREVGGEGAQDYISKYCQK